MVKNVFVLMKVFLVINLDAVLFCFHWKKSEFRFQFCR